MKTLVLFALLLAAASAVPKARRVRPVPMNEVPRSPGSKIVGGAEADPHSWPHQVALFFGLFQGSFCGGSILNEKYILTAAHCAEANPESYRVIVGAHSLDEAGGPSSGLHVARTIVHEGWDRATLANDIALLELVDFLDFDGDDTISPVTLPDVHPDDGEMTTATGWGKTDDGILTGVSDVLMEVDVPVLNLQACKDVYGEEVITENIMCLDTTGGISTCSGDSGGPLNYLETIVGIVSFGASAGCELGYPAGFTKVINYLAWIAANSAL